MRKPAPWLRSRGSPNLADLGVFQSSFGNFEASTYGFLCFRPVLPGELPPSARHRLAGRAGSGGILAQAMLAKKQQNRCRNEN